MKTTGLCIFGALLGLGMAWVITPDAQADDASDWANQLAQAQRDREQADRDRQEREAWQAQQAQAQKEREDWQNQQAQAQKDREDWQNQLAQTQRDREQADRDRQEREAWQAQRAQAQKDWEDWQNQLAQAQKDREQAQKDRDDWQNQLYQAQKDRDDYINKLLQDNVKGMEDMRNEQNRIRQEAIDQAQAAMAGPVAVEPEGPIMEPLAGPAAGPAAVSRPVASAVLPQIHKMTIYNGPVPTVSYFVEGGSPQLKALCQTLQATENKLSLTRESDKLRPGLAQDLIKLRKQVQTELEAEQTMGANAVLGQPPAIQNAQPGAPVVGRAAASQRRPVPSDPVAFQQMVRENQERVRQQMMQRRQVIVQQSQQSLGVRP